VFTPFKGFYHECKKQYGRLSPEKFQDAMCLFMLHAGKRADSSVTQVGIQSLLEMVHYQVSHRVLYIKTEFAKRLMDSVMDIPPEQLHVPYDLFELSFEDNFEILPGSLAPSTLVMLRPQKATLSAVKKFLQITVNYEKDIVNERRRLLKLDEVGSCEANIAESIGTSLRYHYKSPNEDSFCHMSLPLEPYIGEDIDQVIGHLGMVGDPHSVPLAEHEQAVSKKLCRIIFGVQCYLNTLEPQLIAHKDRCRPRLGISPNGLLLGQDFKAEVGWHLRKAHWRFLRDDRYKREADGRIRCVWVHSSEINKEAKPGANERSSVLPEEER